MADEPAGRSDGGGGGSGDLKMTKREGNDEQNQATRAVQQLQQLTASKGKKGRSVPLSATQPPLSVRIMAPSLFFTLWVRANITSHRPRLGWVFIVIRVCTGVGQRSTDVIV